LRDGQTFAIAGLMNQTMTSTMTKIPGIGDIPILGYLFRSKAAQKNQTELVVMITPQILREGSPGVTNSLPKLAEPFLSPLDPKKAIAPPPAAFAVTPGAASSAAAPAPSIATSMVVPAPAAVASVAAPAPVVPSVPVVEAPVVAPDVIPAALPAMAPAPFVEPAPATTPATSADPLKSEASPQRSEQTEAKLREESRLREVRQLAQQAKQQALVESTQKAEKEKK
jgi:hypothetical protein